MKKSYLALISCAVLIPLSAYSTCVTPPDCEELGFTVDTAKCKGLALKCPWDLTKASCKEDLCLKYPNALTACPVSAECTYYDDCSSKVASFTCRDGFEKTVNACLLPLPVLYSDGTASRELYPQKTPIGVVFNESKKWAIALTDANQDGTPGDELMYWVASKASGIGTCSHDYDEDSCTDGKKNTSEILSQIIGRDYFSLADVYVINAVYNYKPTICTNNLLCKAGMWYLPSKDQLQEIYNIKDKVDATLSLLTNHKIIPIGIKCYWSSTAFDYNARTFAMYNGISENRLKDENTCAVRPALTY